MTHTTEKVKHTPGPWFHGTGWIGAGDVMHAKVVARVEGFPYGDTEANVRLIAAAPELLEALREYDQAVRDSVGIIPELRSSYAKVIAAIARAEGKV